LEAESNTGLVPSTQNQSLPILPPLILLSLLLLLPPPYEMSQQPNYPTIIRWLQEQITMLSEQVVARAEGGSAGLEVANPKYLMGPPQRSQNL